MYPKVKSGIVVLIQYYFSTYHHVILAIGMLHYALLIRFPFTLICGLHVHDIIINLRCFATLCDIYIYNGNAGVRAPNETKPSDAESTRGRGGPHRDTDATSFATISKKYVYMRAIRAPL